MTKRARRQHVVSRFYLKGFANEANQLRRVYLPGDRNHPIGLSDATVINDFYTVTLPDGTQSDVFERAFADIEQPAARALRMALRDEWPLDLEDRMALTSWVALQHLRAKGVREGQSQYEAMMIRLVVGVSGKEALRKIIEQAEQRAVSDAELHWEWQDLTKPGGPDLKPKLSAHLQFLTRMHGGLTRYLFASHRTLMRFERRSLLTTDQPVVMSVGPDYPEWRGVGFATADAFIAPLSRHRALIIHPWLEGVPPGHHGPDIQVPGTTITARSINQEVAGQALKHIYMHPADSLVDSLYLPEPDRRQWDSVNADEWIREDGLFHGVPPETLKALSRSTPTDDKKNGFSIKDLTWPIPNRVTSSRPTSW